MNWFSELALDKSNSDLSMGLSKTQRRLTPTSNWARKRFILSYHRDEALIGMKGLESVLWPLEELAVKVEEDLCLLYPVEEKYVLVAGCVCAPSRWKLSDKIGSPVTDIHEPVPHYVPDLARKVDLFLGMLKPGPILTRRNWSIHESSALWSPEVPSVKGVPVGEQWLRSERQTLSKLPNSKAVLFTIQVEQTQLHNLHLDLRAKMGAKLLAETEEVASYHGRPPERQKAIIEWLHACP